MKSAEIRKNIIFVLILMAALPETAVAETEAEDTPSMELLEFLGEWETKEGEWIDQSLLVDTEVAESNDVDYVYTAEEQNNEQ